MSATPLFSRSIVSFPCLETLEDRLLLTTMHGGDTFVFQNSLQQDVHVELQGDPSDTMELLMYLGSYGVLTDVPGVLNGSPFNWTWTVGGRSPSVLNDAGDGWQAADDEHMGAPTEIFSIYVSSCSQDSVLNIWVGDDPEAPWGGTPPNLFMGPDGPIPAPAGSGGAIVGSYEAQDRFDEILYLAAPFTLDGITNVPDWWTYPGTISGPLYPGITVASDAWAFKSGQIGLDVSGLASDSAGRFYYSTRRDLSAKIISSGFREGPAAYAAALVVSDTGSMLTVKNTGTVVPPGSVGALAGGLSSLALAANGRFFGTTALAEFMDISSQTGDWMSDPLPLLLESNPWIRMTSISSMDIDPTTGIIYAIGMAATDDPLATAIGAGPYLIRISPDARVTNYGTATPLVGVSVTAMMPLMYNAAPLPMTEIAFDSTGQMYGLRSSGTAAENMLFQVDKASGGVVEVVAIVDVDNINTGLPMNGLEFIGNQLYGIATANSVTQLWRVNMATGAATGTGILIDPTAPDLAYNDAVNPGLMWTGVGSTLTGVQMGTMLQSVNKANGEVSWINVLTEGTVVYRDLRAMDYAPDGTLYAIGSQYDMDPTTAPDAVQGEQVLLIIDPVTGESALVAPLGNGRSFESIAVSRTGVIYSVEAVTRTLVTIDLAGTVTSLGTLRVDGENSFGPTLEGLEFMPVGASEALFGVSSLGGLWVLDYQDSKGNVGRVDITQVAAGSEVIGDTNYDQINSIAYDPTNPGVLYVTLTDVDPDPAVGALAQILLANMLYTCDVNANTQRLGPIVAAGSVFYQIDALDFTRDDELLGVARVISLDPYHPIAAGEEGPFLIHLIVSASQTSVVTEPIGRISADGTVGTTLTDAKTLAYYRAANSADDLLYLISGTGGAEYLYTIDPTTGLITDSLGQITGLGSTGTSYEEIVSMDFLRKPGATANTLYLVTSWGNATNRIFELDIDSVDATLVMDTGLTGLLSLTGDALTGLLYSALTWEGSDRLVSLLPTPDPDILGRDLGVVAVTGTIVNIINGVIVEDLYTRGGDVTTIVMGWLWGGVTVGGNIDGFVSMTGGGAVLVEEDPRYSDFDPVIWAGASIGSVDSRGVDDITNRIAARAEADPERYVRSSDLEEVEYRSWGMTSLLMGAGQARNDTMQTAQVVGHPSGEFRISGYLYRSSDPDRPDGGDFYALPLMAGQTVVLESWLPFALTDQTGRRVAYYGNDRVDRYSSQASQWAPLVYTAPSAGMYYIEVAHEMGGYSITEAPYEIYVTNGPSAALGGVTIPTAYDSTLIQFNIADRMAGYGDGGNFAAKNGGGVGGINIGGSLYGGNIYSYGDGPIYAVKASIVGGRIVDGDRNYLAVDIYSEGDVGKVFAYGTGIEGYIFGNVTAGGTGLFNNNAHVQSVEAITDYSRGFVTATGSIGVIEVGVTLGDVTLTANSDLLGPGGRIDLITCGFDYGGWEEWTTPRPGFGVPTLNTGPGGDVGYIWAGRDIWAYVDGWHTALAPETITSGRSVTITDDSGGRITLTPEQTQLLDENGDPVFDNGVPVMYTPDYSYIVLGVNGSGWSEGGTGGVLARVFANGSMTSTTSGKVQIGQLTIGTSEATDRPATASLKFSGSGATDIYWVIDGDAPFESFSLSTTGDVFGGLIETSVVTSIKSGGNIGRIENGGRAGTWLHGPVAAPPSANVNDEPQYGWYHGRMNGLDIRSSAELIQAKGSVGDVRVIGRLETVKADTDGYTQAGHWDGINGVVWSQDRIGAVYTGDGLIYEEVGNSPRAGILSTNSIGAVYVDGDYHTVAPRPDADINTLTRGPIAYHELNGIIIGRSNQILEVPSVDLNGQPILDEQGNPVMRQLQVDAIGKVIGTNGARLAGLVSATTLAIWDETSEQDMAIRGGVGTVSFTGRKAQIAQSWIQGQYVRSVFTSSDSDGITFSTITGQGSGIDLKEIGSVVGGGQGILHCNIAASGSIGSITAPDGGKISYTTIAATANVGTIYAKDLVENAFKVSGTIGTLKSARDMKDSNSANFSLDGAAGGYIGSVDKFVVGRDFLRNEFHIAGKLGEMTVGRDFDSVLVMYGPTTADLKSLKVERNMAGEVASYGRIGSIVCGGRIDAEILTVTGGWNNDVDLIRGEQGIFGLVSVDGSLGRIESGVSLGSDPRDVDGYRSQTINVHGDLGTVRVRNGDDLGNLWANFNVGGDIGLLDIDGTLYSEITTFGNLENLQVDGGLGGQIDVDNDGDLDDMGWLDVYGTIGNMRFSTTSDLVADLTVGGSMAGITMRNADIRGTLVSRYGSFGTIEVVNGSIYGDITAQSIGSVRVRNGQLGTVGTPVNITATRGNVGSIEVYGGAIRADADIAGRLGLLRLQNTGSAAGRTISADGGIGLVDVRDGDLDSDVISGRDIAKVLIEGDHSGILSAQTTIGSYQVGGTESGSVRAGTGIIQLKAGSLSGATVSSGWNIGKVKIAGNVMNSLLLAGYDVGPDGAVGGADDNLITGGVHSGNIDAVAIGGQLGRSIVAAGIDPGDLTGGAREAFLSTGDNVEAAGSSSIRKMTIRGGIAGTAAQSGLLADTDIDPAVAAMAAASGAVVESGVNPALDPDVTGYTAFGGSAAGGRTLRIGDLVLTLSGPGTAYFDDATGTIALKNTTLSSKLSIRNSGAERSIVIASGDDSALGSLAASGTVKLANVGIDGKVNKLNVVSAANGAVWTLPGGVGSAKLTNPDDVTVNAGSITAWKMMGDYDGNMSADSIGVFKSAGSVSGDMGSRMGKLAKLVLAGDLSGDLDSYDTIDILSVKGMSGGVEVSHGDLVKLQASGDLTGQVDVTRGQTKLVSTGDDFTGSYRTAGDLIKLISRGDFSGLVAVKGNISKLSAQDMGGRIWAGGNITSGQFRRMDSGMVAASGNVGKLVIRRNMVDSTVLAGLEPGDAGYSNVTGETGNLAIDCWSAPSGDAQNDVACGGAITLVTIGGDMIGSAISAGIDPATDGYFGTGDDLVNGVGYVGLVKVRYGITGSEDNEVSKSYGVFAANSMPRVISYGDGFASNGNAWVHSMGAPAALLTVEDVRFSNRDVTIDFSSLYNKGMVDATTTIVLEMSTSSTFNPGTTTNISSYLLAPTFNDVTNSVTLRLSRGSWETMFTKGLGRYMRLVIDGTPTSIDGDDAIVDTRQRLLDGDNDGRPGGDYVLSFGDDPDALLEALDGGNMYLPLDGGTVSLRRTIENSSDIDVFAFTANAYQFLGVGYQSATLVQMVLLYQDDQGTPGDVRDDTFEAITRPVGFSYDRETYNLSDEEFFQGWELPRTGQYLLVTGFDSIYETGYTLDLTLSSTDQLLVDELGGSLLQGRSIAYISNHVGDHNNLLGALRAKQLVFLNFYGGTATQYSQDPSILVSRMDASDLSPALAGLEGTLINGAPGITGIVDNVISIYSNIPATDPDGTFAVQRISLTDAADWAAYQAADSGLFFTTEDPFAARGLDPREDFTTVFIGSVSYSEYPDQGYGVASKVDLTNQSTADNTIIFTNQMGGWVYGMTTAEIAQRASNLLAWVVSHEMGHAFGLSHQPNDYISYTLLADDPDNNPLNGNDSNQGYGMMSYLPLYLAIDTLPQIGTNILSPSEFLRGYSEQDPPIAYSDHLDQLVWWLA